MAALRGFGIAGLRRGAAIQMHGSAIYPLTKATIIISTIHVAGARPMMRSRGERRTNFAKVVTAAMIAVMAAPAKHTMTTSIKLPKLPGPCNPGTPRPLLKRRNIQAEKKRNHPAEHHRIAPRAGESNCCEECVIGVVHRRRPELSDACGPARQNWQLAWPARVRSSGFC